MSENKPFISDTKMRIPKNEKTALMIKKMSDWRKACKQNRLRKSAYKLYIKILFKTFNDIWAGKGLSSCYIVSGFPSNEDTEQTIEYLKEFLSQNPYLRFKIQITSGCRPNPIYVYTWFDK